MDVVVWMKTSLWHYIFQFQKHQKSLITMMNFFLCFYWCYARVFVYLTILKIRAFVLFLRNFYTRGWVFFKKFPTRRDFFVYLKIITLSFELNMSLSHILFPMHNDMTRLIKLFIWKKWHIIFMWSFVYSLFTFLKPERWRKN